ncbi:MAG: nodulation protein NfeD [Anaerolineales bacterium]|nr:MAG: nodulation protein NfeD [Chloroflexota bacterium]MBE7433647.1 nodulation protein NfeD [Anaerolineales bacterium]MCE7861432.1 nodulation protein NfeD [Chloroflexi bacterium CFX2]GJQ34686.1 MAG: serine protease [Anaerolineaceae bacterium]
MKTRRILLFLIIMLAFAQTVLAQGNNPVAVVLTADGPIMPPMLEYIKRGIETADQRDAEVLVIQLNTPGGSVDTMLEIIAAIRDSDVPVVVYVAPRNAIAGSAGAMITMAGHASAMAPESSIGASSPITSSGEDLNSTADAKAKEIVKASIRPFVTPRGEKALELAEAMIDEAKAVTADEALEAGLIDFIANDLDDLLEGLNGFTVAMKNGPRTLETTGIEVQPLDISFIEQLLLLLTDPNIAFLLLAIGVQAILIELSSPGGWVAGFIGAVCITLAIYGLGVLPVNWFGVIFLIIAFVLFVLDIKAPTHGALTTAGVASFIVGALVLFNSPGTPEFQRVSVPLVVGTGIFLGLIFFAIMMIALRSLHKPISMGAESYVGKTGSAKTFDGEAGQVQLESELWSAEKSPESGEIRKGDKIEVVEVRGLRLIVKKK